MKKLFFVGMLAVAGMLMGSCGQESKAANVKPLAPVATGSTEDCCPGGGSLPLPPPPPPPPRG